ncbi:UNVERIFIED_ORG: phage protease [Shinella sp. XGS7]|nr:phage protease [Shinella sp. XGS7]
MKIPIEVTQATSESPPCHVPADASPCTRCVELQAEVTRLQSELRRAEAGRLFDEGLREGLISTTLIDWAMNLGNEDPEKLRAFLRTVRSHKNASSNQA